MQEQTFDNKYTEPEPMTRKNLKQALHRLDNGSTKRLLVFLVKDEGGRPTKEMRRAWRRYNKNRR